MYYKRDINLAPWPWKVREEGSSLVECAICGSLRTYAVFLKKDFELGFRNWSYSGKKLDLHDKGCQWEFYKALKNV